MRPRRATTLLPLLLLFGCEPLETDGDATVDTGSRDAGDTDAGDAPVPATVTTIRTDVGPIRLDSGEEESDICFFWSLENEEPLFVNAVRLTASPGIHHSNWFHVLPSTFPGEDGIQSCRARSFDTIQAGASGGVLFAQSTQSESDTQQFPEGTALRLPRNSVVVAQVHLLNTTARRLDIEAEVELDLIPEASVHTRLHGLAFDYLDLEIPPRMESEFSMDCDFTAPTGGEPIDFRIFYMLPHYHELGLGMRVELIGGERDGELFWESFSTIGEPLGESFDPPLELGGATGLRVTCVYDNPRPEMVGYGIGDQEMCLMLAFTDSEFVWGGGSLNFTDNQEVRVADGVSYNEAPCQMVAFRPR